VDIPELRKHLPLKPQLAAEAWLSAGNQHTRDTDHDGDQCKKHAQIHGAESSVTPVIQGAEGSANPATLAGVQSKTGASHNRE
jgi:hypothetical protein